MVNFWTHIKNTNNLYKAIYKCYIVVHLSSITRIHFLSSSIKIYSTKQAVINVTLEVCTDEKQCIKSFITMEPTSIILVQESFPQVYMNEIQYVNVSYGLVTCLVPSDKSSSLLYSVC